MALNNINFNKQSAGLGRALTGKDHYSGIVFYGTQSEITSGYDTFYSITDVEDLGITSGSLYDNINEYFRMHNQGKLDVGVFPISGTAYGFSEVSNLQDYSEGELRQILVLSDQEFSTSAVSALQSQATLLETSNRPTQFILEGDFTSFSTVDDLPNIRVDGQKNISVVVGKDAEATTYTAAATLLGVISNSLVSENVGWVEKFNIESGTNYDNVELVTGEDITTISDTELEAIGDKGYITLRKFTDYAGVYFTDSQTADLSTSDLSSIENNRTIDKAVRNVRLALLPDLNSPSSVNTDGTLTVPIIEYFKSKAENVLQAMVNSNELSAYQVIIDPDQDVVTTSTLNISLNLVPIGVNRYINVNIGFVTNIQ